MRIGIVNGWPPVCMHTGGDLIVAEPTNRRMRRLAAKQAGQKGKGARQRPFKTTSHIEINRHKGL